MSISKRVVIRSLGLEDHDKSSPNHPRVVAWYPRWKILKIKLSFLKGVNARYEKSKIEKSCPFSTDLLEGIKHQWLWKNVVLFKKSCYKKPTFGRS